MPGTLHVVGIGPGAAAQMTPAAEQVIRNADVITGYRTYIDLIPHLLTGKEVFATGMRQEVERCREALQRAAEGARVAMICSGDAGIYGMAGLVLELADGLDVEIEVIPGISAVQAAAALLGAPLMHDFAVISLSDLLTPWQTICRRLEAVGSADFVVALYNPKSRGRTTQIVEARDILLLHRESRTPVGIVRNASRPGESVVVTDLGSMLDQEIDMFSVVIIGNSTTFVDARGKLVTPRGYNVTSSAARAETCESADEDFPARRSAAPAHKAKALFVGGTGSDVGKSIIVAGLCRILYRHGFSVAPFKAQNMALNSAVTPEGGEIGRAQALQAAACKLDAHTDMNPILLKPNSETGAQVVVNGRPLGNMSVSEYHGYKTEAFRQVEAAFGRLAARHQVIVMEGAGSIAEINLKAHDITNLKAAVMAGAPVVLVADIDRGGVFASIVGTLELLAADERAMLAGVIINKFRGDAALLRPGIEFLEEKAGLPVLGVVPWLKLALPEEDSVALERKRRVPRGGALRIGVLRLRRLSNYTDFDPFEREADVDLVYLDDDDFAGLDLLILPGTKNTLEDLADLRQRGLDRAIIDYHRSGGNLIGICGGYQMLGRRISDPAGVESSQGTLAGFGLLDIETTMSTVKQTHQSHGALCPAAAMAGFVPGEPVSGYEIHMGETTLGGQARPLLQLSKRSDAGVALEDGAVSTDGRVWGTYLHDIFSLPGIRQQLLNHLRGKRGLPAMPCHASDSLDQELDRLADHLEQHLDLDALLKMLKICPAEEA